MICLLVCSFFLSTFSVSGFCSNAEYVAYQKQMQAERAYLSTLPNYTASTNTVSISTKEELENFSTSVNGGTTYSGVTVSLTNDIDLGSSKFTPIGTFSSTSTNLPFRGTFDGNNHTIKNLKVSESKTGQAGLFWLYI